jgi:hypothetical protein
MRLLGRLRPLWDIAEDLQIVQMGQMSVFAASWSAVDVHHDQGRDPRSTVQAQCGRAAQWYNPRQPGLGEKFIREVDRAIASILENPLAFSVHSLPP